MSIIRKEQLSNPLSASYAETASFALNAGGSSIDTGSLVTTSSFNAYTASINNFTSSYNTGSFSGSFTGNLSGTASFASTASYVNPLRQNVQITGSLLVSNSIDSQDRQLLGFSGEYSVDWLNRALYDNSQITVDWLNRNLLDNDGNPSITWGSRKLKTPIGYEIDYNSDRVFESDTFLSDNISETILEDFATNGDGPWYAGHVIQGQIVNDTGVVCKAVGQTDWYRPRLDRASEAGTLLGIRIDSTSVLLQGDIVVNDSDSGIGFYVLDGGFTMGPGYKVYLNSAGMSLEVPTSGYVRELGYIYYASTGDGKQFIMRFNPSNDYYLLS